MLWLGDFARVLAFTVAIIISSECYLSTLSASRVQCRRIFRQVRTTTLVRVSAHCVP